MQINEEMLQISFKRLMAEEYSVENAPTYTETSTVTDDEDVYRLIPSVRDAVKNMGRLEDFIALLQAITNGYLGDNIAFHLLLDVGNFYS